MHTTLKGQLLLSDKLSLQAQSAFVLNDLKTGTLISLAQLCDDDCVAIFSKYDVKLLKNNEIVIEGSLLECPMDCGCFPSPPTFLPIKPTASSAPTNQSKSSLRIFMPLSAALLLPPSCRGHLITIPGLTMNLILKHLPKSVATTLAQ
jgi:hypothetical protein